VLCRRLARRKPGANTLRDPLQTTIPSHVQLGARRISKIMRLTASMAKVCW
jgi:hypothetical protein